MSQDRQPAGQIQIHNHQSLNLPSHVFFYEGENIIGRSKSKATVVIKENSISQMHARLMVKGSKMTITDLSSKNGTKINTQTNILQPNVGVDIDFGTCFYLAQIRFVLERHMPPQQQAAQEAEPEKEETQKEEPSEFKEEVQPKRELKVGQQTEQPEVKGEFSITAGFDPEVKKSKKANTSKEKDKKNKELKKSKKEEEQRKKEQERTRKEQQEAQRIRVKEEQRRREKSRRQAEEKAKEQQSEKLEVEEQKDKKRGRKSKDTRRKQESQSLEVEEPKGKKRGRQSKDARSKEESESLEVEKPEPKKKGKAKKSPSPQRNQASRQSVQVQKKPSPPKKKESLMGKGIQTKKYEKRKRVASDSLEREIGVLPAKRESKLMRIMFSGFPGKSVPSERMGRKIYEQVDNIDNEFDYLVMPQYIRSIKALYAICKGIPIVDYKWVSECKSFAKGLDYQNYYFKKIKYVYDAIEMAARGRKVFNGFKFYLASEYYHIAREDLETLIYASGAEVFSKVGDLSAKQKKDGQIIALVRNQETSEMKAEVAKLQKNGYRHIHQVDFFIEACQKQSIGWDVGKVGDSE